MTDKEILQKAIKKAEKNGYLIPIFLSEIFKGIEDKSRNLYYTWRISKIEVFLYFDNSGRVEEESLILSVNDIIFSHDFCKAFWGEKFTKNDRDIYGNTCDLYFYRWQLHLTSLVLEQEPLKYLERFLNEDK